MANKEKPEKKADEPKKDAVPKEKAKKEESKNEVKKEKAKKEEPKKEVKKEETKNEEPKKETKKEETKNEEPAKEEKVEAGETASEQKAEDSKPEESDDKQEDSNEVTSKKIGLFGEKIGMTQVFDEDGNLSPATVIKIYNGTIVQLKTSDKDGYDAIKVAFKEEKPERINKPLSGIFSKTKINPHRMLREFRVESVEGLQVGNVLSLKQFTPGDFVDVKGTSKGKGFQGVVKKFNFQGSPKTRGSGTWRSAGSIGAGTDPGRVWKGHPMPGRMGFETKTIQNLRIININPEKGLLLIKGSVPGPRNSIIRILPAVKKVEV